MDPEPSINFFARIDFNTVFGILAIVFFLFCSAMVSAAEVAMFSLTQKDLSILFKQDATKANVISKLLQKPKKLLATILVANNFSHIGVVIIFSFVGNSIFSVIESEIIKFILEVILVTFLILLFGEVLPKIYASRNNIQFSKFVANPIYFLDKFLSPISYPMRSVSMFLQEKLGKQKSSISVDQLSQALELTSTEDTSTEEQKILEGIVSFGNTDTKQVMSPRIDIFALEINETFAEIYDKIVEKGYSRIPVFRENIDHIEGVLFVKDLIPHINKKDFDWKALLREPFFVPENKKLDDLLKEFQSKKSHLAIVVDEYGGTSGLVSLEDVIEEIVGDISDEFDDESLNYSQLDDKVFLFEGKTNLKDFYRILEVEEETFENNKGEAETLAGFVLEILGNFPKKGQKIHFSTVSFTIESVDRKRIKQLKVTLE